MTEHIEQAHWEAFLNDFSRTHHGFEARLEIMDRDFGDQEVATWLPFTRELRPLLWCHSASDMSG